MKEINKLPEKEISFMELMWDFLHHWRRMLLCLVAFAILAGGMRYASDWKSASTVDGQETQSLAEMEKNLNEEEKKQIEQAKKIEENLIAKQTYQEESILMNIDPFNESCVTLQYYVNCNYAMNLAEDIRRDRTSDIVNAYAGYIDDGKIASVIEGADKYTAELISREISKETGMFVIKILGKNMDEANALADEIDTVIKEYHSKIEQTITQHELQLLNRGEEVLIDSDLLDKQDSLYNTINALQQKLDEVTEEMNAEQLQVFMQVQDSNPAQTDAVQVVINKKYVVVGAFAGIFLSFLWSLINFVFGKKLKYKEEIENMYGIRVFGEISKTDKPKEGLFDKVDKCIDRLQRNRKTEIKEQCEYIQTLITVSCKREKKQKVLFASSCQLDNPSAQIVGEIGSLLKKSGIDSQFASAVLENTESIALLEDYDCVVIVEKIGESQYSHLHKEIQLLDGEKINVIGALVFA